MLTSSGFLPYHEPSIVTILIYSSFFLLLNVTNYLFNFLCCGLIGQILIGVAFGSPGAGWLSRDDQTTITNIGYLGLIFMVYEGGLSTELASLRSNAYLSSLVALIGVTVPIALSFLLCDFANASKLQAFAAGAALCSTSLGTTFTTLRTSGLAQSRLGVILINAAMLDDVVGLIMVQIISSLDPAMPNISPATIIRPIGVSLAFIVVTPAACILVRKSLMSIVSERLSKYTTLAQFKVCAQSLTLLAFVAGSSYAGTSNLFAAYIAGIIITWFDDSKELDDPQQSASDGTASQPNRSTQVLPTHHTGLGIYNDYFDDAVTRILKPCFFASIGFSIPLTDMFAAEVLWRGCIYAVLMVFGKLLCGLVLIRFNISPVSSSEQPINSPLQQKQYSHHSLYPAVILGSAMVARGEIGLLISSVAESEAIFGTAGRSNTSQLFLIVTWGILICTIAGPLVIGLLVRRVRRLQTLERNQVSGRQDPLGIWGFQ
ncbi:Sodium/hydrogen exchanger [Myriangium duriaei CBS 260.36]|uniref:Sodium/hydrogen exchanger n=1 Tax=Myriangium duriaei CBS 260.36 TaxID=1168546 RepID=A0A9P4MJF3_9PEZI|nr:Sodium/hydrogen exchanger [Myriangium duriaei CBS 260.36]